MVATWRPAPVPRIGPTIDVEPTAQRVPEQGARRRAQYQGNLLSRREGGALSAKI